MPRREGAAYASMASVRCLPVPSGKSCCCYSARYGVPGETPDAFVAYRLRPRFAGSGGGRSHAPIEAEREARRHVTLLPRRVFPPLPLHHTLPLSDGLAEFFRVAARPAATQLPADAASPFRHAAARRYCARYLFDAMSECHERVAAIGCHF